MTKDFATCSLSEGDTRRLSRVAPNYREEGYLDAFDATTLWFDAIWHEGQVTLVCPRLNNLATLFQRGKVALDGVEATPRLRHFYRHSLARMRSPAQPSRVSLTHDGMSYETAVRPSAPERFREKNVILTMSRDNDLVWIEDYARFHAETQGAESIVFVDNGSARYGTADIRRVLQQTGLDALVLQTDRIFGPRGRAPYAHSELFLQTCVLNAVRLRYLQQARAVLCCDIDELVLSQGRASIFDATSRSSFGFIRFKGVWRYAPPTAPGAVVRHRDHVLRKPGKPDCPPKWCIRPGGPMGELQWRPHILEGFRFNWLFLSRAFTYHHCRHITTGWKRDPGPVEAAKLVAAEPAMEMAQRTGAAVDKVPRRGVARPHGWATVICRLGEATTRVFFGLRPSHKFAAVLLMSGLGIVLEEVVDQDPMQQEITVLLQSLQSNQHIDQLERTFDAWF